MKVLKTFLKKKKKQFKYFKNESLEDVLEKKKQFKVSDDFASIFPRIG